MITFFKILLTYAGFITFLHAVIPHVHHETELEVEHQHSQNSLYDILELAFHNSQSFGSTDSFIVDEDFYQNDFHFHESLIIKWLREQQIFVYHTLSFNEVGFSSFYSNCSEYLRGPPSFSV